MRNKSRGSTAHFDGSNFQKDEFKTLDTNVLDEELAMIRRIYDNFNKHKLPIKTYKDVRSSKASELFTSTNRALSQGLGARMSSQGDRT